MKPTVTTTALARSRVFNPYLLGGLGYSNPYLLGSGLDTTATLRNSLALRASGYLGYGGLGYGGYGGYGGLYGNYYNNRLWGGYNHHLLRHHVPAVVNSEVKT